MRTPASLSSQRKTGLLSQACNTHSIIGMTVFKTQFSIKHGFLRKPNKTELGLGAGSLRAGETGAGTQGWEPGGHRVSTSWIPPSSHRVPGAAEVPGCEAGRFQSLKVLLFSFPATDHLRMFNNFQQNDMLQSTACY